MYCERFKSPVEQRVSYDSQQGYIRTWVECFNLSSDLNEFCAVLYIYIRYIWMIFLDYGLLSTLFLVIYIYRVSMEQFGTGKMAKKNPVGDSYYFITFNDLREFYHVDFKKYKIIYSF